MSKNKPVELIPTPVRDDSVIIKGDVPKFENPPPPPPKKEE